jgi:hypothetical protein
MIVSDVVPHVAAVDLEDDIVDGDTNVCMWLGWP